MKELFIAGALGLGALLLTQTPKKEVEVTPVVETVDVCNCAVTGVCLCEDCQCVGCPHKQKMEPVVEREVVVQKVENDFDASYLESDLEDVKSKVFSMQSDLNLLGNKVKVLESKPHLTEEKVKEIVKTEFKVQLEFMNTKTNEKVTKDLTVQNTGSEIVLEPGEILTHIDGVRVNGNPYTELQNGKRTMMFRTPSYQFNVPQYSNSQPVRARILPRFNNFSTCGPNGCN